MHTGTSASAPLAAGIFALVLQAKYDTHSVHAVRMRQIYKAETYIVLL